MHGLQNVNQSLQRVQKSWRKAMLFSGCLNGLYTDMRPMPCLGIVNILRNLRLQGGNAVKLGFVAQLVQKGYLDALAV